MVPSTGTERHDVTARVKGILRVGEHRSVSRDFRLFRLERYSSDCGAQ
jgi:hypothetical protein